MIIIFEKEQKNIGFYNNDNEMSGFIVIFVIF